MAVASGMPGAVAATSRPSRMATTTKRRGSSSEGEEDEADASEGSAGPPESAPFDRSRIMAR